MSSEARKRTSTGNGTGAAVRANHARSSRSTSSTDSRGRAYSLSTKHTSRDEQNTLHESSANSRAPSPRAVRRFIPGTRWGTAVARRLAASNTRLASRSSSSVARHRDSGPGPSPGATRSLRFTSTRSVWGNQCRSRWSWASASACRCGSRASSDSPASLACSRKAGTHCSSTSVTTPSAPSPTRAAANTSGSVSAEQDIDDPSASTRVSPLTAAAMPWSRAPVPWVPVAMAPLIVWRSMSPRLGRASPTACEGRVEHVQGCPREHAHPLLARRRPRRCRSAASRWSSSPSVATSGVKEWPEPATRTSVPRRPASTTAVATSSAVAACRTSAGWATTVPAQFRQGSLTRSTAPRPGSSAPSRRADRRRRGGRS